MMTFKTWNTNGTAATYHRTTVLNKVADALGFAGYKAAAALIGDAEYVSGVTANSIVSTVAA